MAPSSIASIASWEVPHRSAAVPLGVDPGCGYMPSRTYNSIKFKINYAL